MKILARGPGRLGRHDYPHSTDDDSEAQRGKATCHKVCPWQSQGWAPGEGSLPALQPTAALDAVGEVGGDSTQARMQDASASAFPKPLLPGQPKGQPLAQWEKRK